MLSMNTSKKEKLVLFFVSLVVISILWITLLNRKVGANGPYSFMIMGTSARR
jgi:hypothetical protein